MDGYTYMCRDKENNHYLQHKRNDDENALIFENEYDAQKYIDENLEMSSTMQLYKTEFILYSVDLVKDLRIEKFPK